MPCIVVFTGSNFRILCKYHMHYYQLYRTTESSNHNLNYTLLQVHKITYDFYHQTLHITEHFSLKEHVKKPQKLHQISGHPSFQQINYYN